MEAINVAIIGMGTVGQGVAMLLLENQERLEKQLGGKIVLRRLLEKDYEKELDFDRGDIPISDNWKDVVDDPEIHIVVEVMGGIEPARTFISEALKSGKHVVTANKDLLAEHGQELFAIAKASGVDLYFEASVGGAIPVLSSLRQNLGTESIKQIMGIVNGTTNYILTRMTNEGGDFQEILADAQRLGYAEANPAADVEGTDAARKTAVLATLAFHSEVTLADVFVEGITGITREDILFAERLGYAIKLIALCKEVDGRIEARVHPTLLPKDHPLAAVHDVFNAVFIKTAHMDDMMLYGRGAGRFPTAGAVLGDIAEIARNIRLNAAGRLTEVSSREKAIVPIEDVETRFFLRLLLADKPGVLAAVAKVLSDYHVNLEKVNQTDFKGEDAELVIVTRQVREGDMRKALEELRGLAVTKEIITVLRVEGVS